jgi:hydrogenase nickel incorporation protein HypA/HybF
MHETGIAAEILDIAGREAARRGAAGVAAITVKVGDLSGVVADALEFAFDALCSGTSAEGARLHILRVPVIARCMTCARDYQPGAELVLWCPDCGRALEVTAGQELQVESLELMEAPCPNP